MDKNLVFQSLQISEKSSIRESVKKMDLAGAGIIFLTDSNSKVTGVLSDGDFRRAVLAGVSLEAPVSSIMNQKYRFLEMDYSLDDAKSHFGDGKVRILPVLDSNRVVQEVLSLEEFKCRSDLDDFNLKPMQTINYPVVIMAGGKGTRLDPFTKIIPKPLIPVGEKPMIEVIMDNFSKFGMNKFFVSINYKGKMIRAYFEEHQSNYELKFFEEPKPMGTIGAVKLIEDQIKGPFFLSNCDVFIDADYTEVPRFHNTHGNDLTIVASLQYHRVPYGICEIGTNGELLEIREKPEYDFLVNTGFYFLNPSIFEFIPKEQFFDMPDLIKSLKRAGKKIGVYPVSQGAWTDTGQLSELNDAFQKFNGEALFGAV